MAATEKGTGHVQQKTIIGASAALVSTAAWAKTSNMGLPEPPLWETAEDAGRR